MNDESLLTEEEAAKVIGWSHSNLRSRRRQLSKGAEDVAPPHRWISGGRHGGRFYYSSEEIEAWLERHPEIARKSKRIEETLSQDQVCEALALSRSALRARRSQLRSKGDSTAAPVHVMAGQEVRYSARAVWEWAQLVNWKLQPIDGVRIEDMISSENDAISAGEA